MLLFVRVLCHFPRFFCAIIDFHNMHHANKSPFATQPHNLQASTFGLFRREPLRDQCCLMEDDVRIVAFDVELQRNSRGENGRKAIEDLAHNH